MLGTFTHKGSDARGTCVSAGGLGESSTSPARIFYAETGAKSVVQKALKIYDPSASVPASWNGSTELPWENFSVLTVYVQKYYTPYGYILSGVVGEIDR